MSPSFVCICCSSVKQFHMRWKIWSEVKFRCLPPNRIITSIQLRISKGQRLFLLAAKMMNQKMMLKINSSQMSHSWSMKNKRRTNKLTNNKFWGKMHFLQTLLHLPFWSIRRRRRTIPPCTPDPNELDILTDSAYIVVMSINKMFDYSLYYHTLFNFLDYSILHYLVFFVYIHVFQ